MGLFVAGINPRRPVFLPTGQQLADAAGRRAFLANAAGYRGLAEALLLIDGARAELYAVAEAGCDAYDIAAGLFGGAIGADVAGALYFAEGLDAASHLFAALCDLDEFAGTPAEGRGGAASLVPFADGAGRPMSPSVDAERAVAPFSNGSRSRSSNGSGEISKGAQRQADGPLSAGWARAQAEARQAGSLGPVLASLADAARRLAGALAACASSTSAAALGETAVELARRAFGHLERRSVLILGSGGLAATLGEAFARAGVDDFAFLGTEAEQAVARAAGIRTATPEGLAVLIGNADVVLAGSPVEGVVFDRRLMKGAVRLRRGRPLLLIDGGAEDALIDRRAASFDGVFLYTADDLAAITRDAPWAHLGTADTRERLLADATRAFALELDH